MADYRDIKDKNGMDAYFYVRFLRMIVRILVPIWLISWLILLPTTSVGTTVGAHSGLDRFIFGNVAPDSEDRAVRFRCLCRIVSKRHDPLYQTH